MLDVRYGRRREPSALVRGAGQRLTHWRKARRDEALRVSGRLHTPASTHPQRSPGARRVPVVSRRGPSTGLRRRTPGPLVDVVHSPVLAGGIPPRAGAAAMRSARNRLRRVRLADRGQLFRGRPVWGRAGSRPPDLWRRLERTLYVVPAGGCQRVPGRGRPGAVLQLAEAGPRRACCDRVAGEWVEAGSRYRRTGRRGLMGPVPPRGTAIRLRWGHTPWRLMMAPWWREGRLADLLASLSGAPWGRLRA